MVHRHRQETWYTGTDKRKTNYAKAHKQGDMIYTSTYRDMEHTGTYRDMEHTVTYRDMEPTCTNRRHGTQAQTKGKMIYRHTDKETWYTQEYTET